VSDANLFDSAIRSIQQNRVELQALQIRASTGRRINRVSDDPSGAAQVLSIRRTIERIAQFKRNIDSARADLETSENALNGVTNVLIRLRELAVSADIETAEFDLIMPEAEEQFEELIKLANSQSGKKNFIFGGFLNGSAPFAASGGFTAGSPSPTVTFSGDTGEVQVQIGENAFLTTNLNGREIFTGDVQAGDVGMGDTDDALPDPPRVNIFELVGDFRDALRTQDTAAIGQAIEDFDQALDQVLTARGIGGARLNRLEASRNQLEALDVTLEVERSSIEDDDFVRTVTELQNRETTFEASLAITARVMQRSLLDFIR
jgi:flagellar hook-associated protein 3 FlgL